jgi:hypothetical protein
MECRVHPMTSGVTPSLWVLGAAHFLSCRDFRVRSRRFHWPAAAVRDFGAGAHATDRWASVERVFERSLLAREKDSRRESERARQARNARRARAQRRQRGRPFGGRFELDQLRCGALRSSPDESPRLCVVLPTWQQRTRKTPGI